jgi:hypothetical protein
LTPGFLLCILGALQPEDRNGRKVDDRETPKSKGGRPKEAAGALGVLLFQALMILMHLG